MSPQYLKSHISSARLPDSEVLERAYEKLRELRVQPVRRVAFAEGQRGKSISQGGHLKDNVSFALYRTKRGGCLVVNLFARNQVEKFFFESRELKALSMQELQEQRAQEARIQQQEMQAHQEREQLRLKIQEQLSRLRLDSIALNHFQCGIIAGAFEGYHKETQFNFGDTFIKQFLDLHAQGTVPDNYLARRALYCLPTVSTFVNVPQFIPAPKLPSEIGYPSQVDYFKQEYGSIIVPVESPFDHTVLSLQHINSKGHKRFLMGGRVAGGCFKPHGYSVNASTKAVILCEGVATTNAVAILFKRLWSDYRKVGFPNLQAALVLGCFDAHNIKVVAQAIRARYPHIKILIAADNDHHDRGIVFRSEAQFMSFLDKNTGVKVAYELKRTLPNVHMLIPPPVCENATDWHDFLCLALNDWSNFEKFESVFANAVIKLLNTPAPLLDINPYEPSASSFWYSLPMQPVMEKISQARFTV